MSSCLASLPARSVITSLRASIHSCMSRRSIAARMSSSLLPSPDVRRNELRMTRPPPLFASVSTSTAAFASRVNVFSPWPELSVSRCSKAWPTTRNCLTCQVCFTSLDRVRLRNRPSLRVCTRSTIWRYSDSFDSISPIFADDVVPLSVDRALCSSSSACVSCSELKWSVSDFSHSACIFSFSSRSTARCAAIWFSSACADSNCCFSALDRVSVCRRRVVASASFFCRSKTIASLSEAIVARRLISTSSLFSSSTSRTALRCSSPTVVEEEEECSSSCDLR
mmetsp:Transcript_31707/g.106819  ORF Transcript_31707/g.106819 Transcript_31707/m.106819 type:complete len:281 (-) Transcript_31707:2580-3422(-)